MSRYVVLSLAAAGALLSGCATQRQQQVGPRYSLQDDPTVRCIDQVAQDPYLVGTLGPKTGLGSKAPPSLEMRADPARPSEEEKKAISAYAAARADCLQRGESYRAVSLPLPVYTSMARGWRGIDALLVRLYSGEITYGQYNQLRMENGEQSRENIARGYADAERDRAQAEAAEDDRRRAAIGMALQNMQMQQSIQQQQQIQQQQMLQMNRPRTTNCQRIGSQLNCTTY